MDQEVVDKLKRDQIDQPYYFARKYLVKPGREVRCRRFENLQSSCLLGWISIAEMTSANCTKSDCRLSMSRLTRAATKEPSVASARECCFHRLKHTRWCKLFQTLKAAQSLGVSPMYGSPYCEVEQMRWQFLIRAAGTDWVDPEKQ